ncbi:phage head closure protein [Taklimakanibacter deserti]|uniref:phage head closure protein n=1 Tax=Taklimakanibacter deserti TaxID=2267839 RepID=UPI000E650BED
MARAGTLNKRVTFQHELRTPDGGGGFAREWSEIATVWGGFSPERGSERLEAGRLEGSLFGVLRVRSSPTTRTVKVADRVKIDGVDHQIRSISNPDQRNRMLDILVERGVAT